jgi:hypothetical protein
MSPEVRAEMEKNVFVVKRAKVGGFIPITIEEYVALSAEHIPDVDTSLLRTSIQKALKKYKTGVNCSCGNPIWVIGSGATGEDGCFQCISNMDSPQDDYELEEAMK